MYRREQSGFLLCFSGDKVLTLFGLTKTGCSLSFCFFDSHRCHLSIWNILCKILPRDDKNSYVSTGKTCFLCLERQALVCCWVFCFIWPTQMSWLLAKNCCVENYLEIKNTTICVVDCWMHFGHHEYVGCFMLVQILVQQFWGQFTLNYHQSGALCYLQSLPYHAMP